MTSSDEMYERGVEDAAHDELNPFYYQHYYYYRRGYDETRRYMRRTGGNQPGQPQPRRWLFLVGFLLLVLAGAGLAFLPVQTANNAGTEDTPPIERMPAAAESAVANVQPPTQTPLTLPSPTPEGLYVGRLARVANVGTTPLLARSEPGTQYPVQARFPENMQVTIVDGPVVADNYTWWRVEGETGSGWSAERSQEGNLWLIPE